MSERLFAILFPSRFSHIRSLEQELSSLREQNASHFSSISRLTEERDRAREDAAEARRNENVTLQKLYSAVCADSYRTDPFGFAPVPPPAAEHSPLPHLERVREARQRKMTEMGERLVPVTPWHEQDIEKYLRRGRPENGAEREKVSAVDAEQSGEV